MPAIGRAAAAKAFASAVCLTLAAAAAAQSLVIPDFRRQASPTIARAPDGPCADCGRILSIREVALERRLPPTAGSQIPSSGPGDRPLVGAIMVLPIGRGSDQPFVGGVGTAEMRERFGESTYEITVRLDDGAIRTVQRQDGTRFRTGDRVRLTVAGELELLG